VTFANAKGVHVILDELDGVAAAPDNHKVLFENEEVRVLQTTIMVGEITPLHTHLRPTVLYVLSGSHFIRRDQAGATLLDTRANPDHVLQKVMFSASSPRHTIENTGPDDLVVIGVELKNSRAGDPASVR
jgi:mannose-6-phosphate isomerase-like protein (cupin superfamily)